VAQVEVVREHGQRGGGEFFGDKDDWLGHGRYSGSVASRKPPSVASRNSRSTRPLPPSPAGPGPPSGPGLVATGADGHPYGTRPREPHSRRQAAGLNPTTERARPSRPPRTPPAAPGTGRGRTR